MLVCPNDMFPLFPPHLTVRLMQVNALSAVTMRYDGLLGLCLLWSSWGRSGRSWMTSEVLSTGRMPPQIVQEIACEPVSKNPRTFALFLSLSSPNQIVLRAGEVWFKCPMNSTVGILHFIEHNTNYWHLKLSLQFWSFLPMWYLFSSS